MKDKSWIELSRKGGRTTLKKHGSAHFREIGAKGRESLIKKDPEFFKKLSKQGILARKKKKIAPGMVKILDALAGHF